MKVKSILVAGALSLAMTAPAMAARDYISIVGSSTVYPFATVVAEQFGKTTGSKTPKIESTGSGIEVWKTYSICNGYGTFHGYGSICE